MALPPVIGVGLELPFTRSQGIDLALPAIAARLAARSPQRYTGPADRRAAVAAVLRPGPIEPELLLIRRAERVGDPWSGHMALPGGHHAPSDRDMLATALRETREEVGLDLTQHDLLGPLDEYPATARGAFTGIVIAPFVFALRSAAEVQPNHEVADYIWTPLGSMARGESDVVKELERDGQLVRFPGFGVGEHVVWGLTHRVLRDFFSLLGENESLAVGR
jgi:8-oxo-dGTP pyrophosphatase MutT (NUDIX family)